MLCCMQHVGAGAMITPNQRRAQQRVATKKAISTFWSRAERNHAEQLVAAKAILEAPEKYQGEQAAVVIWARTVVRRKEESA